MHLSIVKVCRCLVAGSPVSSTNKTYHHHITEIFLKVALKTITLTLTLELQICMYMYKNANSIQDMAISIKF
jgi:hypothetical protein